MEIKYEKYYGLSRVASHPLVLITSFLTLILVGDGIDGLVLYLVAKGIVTGDLSSILPIAGIILLLLSWIIYKRRLEFQLEAFMNIAGSLCFTVFIVMLRNSGKIGIFENQLKFSLPYIMFLIFVLIQAIHTIFNIFYSAYGWDELEMERRINRKLDKNIDQFPDS